MASAPPCGLSFNRRTADILFKIETAQRDHMDIHHLDRERYTNPSRTMTGLAYIDHSRRSVLSPPVCRMIHRESRTVQFLKTLASLEFEFCDRCLMTSDPADAAATDDRWTTSPSLLARAQEQDDDSWKQIVHLYGPLVAYWCRQATVSASDIDDVVQDIFLSIARELPQFRYDRPGDSFRGWIRVITRRRVADYFRRLNGRPSAEGGTTACRRLNEIADPVAACFDSDPEAESEELSIACRSLELIRNHFQPSTWTAFWRTAIENVPTAEVAEQLQMSQSAVRMARSRVLNRLRQELAGLVSLSENSFQPHD